MRKIHFLLFAFLILFFSQCAKKGRPSGGPKDEDAPLFVTADPPYESINFDKNEINIYFNEYIKLKDLNKQLIVSPPLNPSNPSLISPQGSPSKFINIKILDTLKENSTYIFDFGNSVQDNNESNTLERFKYVFSTGTYIDSLTLEGSVKNSFKSEDLKNIKLLLYRLDSSYSDSAVYKRKPDYVTSSLDTSNYKFSNLRKGNYLLVALNDERSDYLFNPKADEIGFLKDTISLPRDSILKDIISIFKEELPYKFKRGKEISKGQLILGYEGKATKINIETLSAVPDNFQTITFPEKDKDTINLWHTPIERDSLIFKVNNNGISDTIVIKLRKKEIDSLKVSPQTTGVLDYKDTLFLSTNNPIIKIDTTKINFIDTDTINILYTPYISKKENKIGFIFQKKFKKTYKLNVYPNALTDIFNTSNDTIISQFKTRSLEDYGEITLDVKNTKMTPIIIQLTDINDKTIAQETTSVSKNISFKYLNPNRYKIRIIYDTNNNGKWDTGNYLAKKQPELVEYLPEIQEVRANWQLPIVLNIKELFQ
ncbi:Ig-like domain-containing protein [Flavobacteriaceae bacterium]|nr:Ig-like domain-containing protein [Flavobacteriaceae bacterium]MDC0870157.1 Ig-like domain-containing protein [Flavobacteriaceae bacterium]